MDVYELGDLRKYIARKHEQRTKITEQAIWNVLAQLASALSYCHDPNRQEGHEFGTVIHRDIKPENILIGANATVVFSDFGICRALEGSRMTNTILGTVVYAAPEIANRQAYTEKVDIWSLGCTIYEMCAQDFYIRARNLRELVEMQKQRTLQGLDVVRLGYSKKLQDVLKQMLELDPRRRPSAAELCQDQKVREMLKDRTDFRVMGEDVPQHQPQIPAQVQAPPSRQKPVSRNAYDRERENVSAGTPLIEAAKTGNLRLAKQYLSEIRKRDQDGRTALIHAASNGHKEIVDLLKKDEAGLKDNSGRFALLCAYSYNHLHIVAALGPLEGDMMDDQNRTVLILAARAGHAAVAMKLTSYSAGHQDENGISALMYAVNSNLQDVAKALAPREAGLRSKKGWTALMEASRAGNAEIVKLLMKREAKMTTPTGWTALMSAASEGASKACLLLIPYEAKMTDTLGETALMKAARTGKADTIKLLLKEEAGIMRKDGKTALMCAAEANHVECVRMLLPVEGGRRKADGQTALFFALKSGRNCVPLLIGAEARIALPDGTTPAQYAQARGLDRDPSFAAVYESLRRAVH